MDISHSRLALDNHLWWYGRFLSRCFILFAATLLRLTEVAAVSRMSFLRWLPPIVVFVNQTLLLRHVALHSRHRWYHNWLARRYLVLALHQHIGPLWGVLGSYDLHRNFQCLLESTTLFNRNLLARSTLQLDFFPQRLSGWVALAVSNNTTMRLW